MSIILKGVIKDGQISLPTKLDLPEGKEVTVRVEDAATATPEKDVLEQPFALNWAKSAPVKGTRSTVIPPQVVLTPEEWAALPFHGEWKDRTDITDSVEYVNELRKEWESRASKTT